MCVPLVSAQDPFPNQKTQNSWDWFLNLGNAMVNWMQVCHFADTCLYEACNLN